MDKNKPYLIAETAYIFEGDKIYLEKIIDKLKQKEACDAIKYHILINIDDYMTKEHQGYNLIKNFLLTQNEWIELLNKTKKNGFETIVLTDDKEAINFCKKNIDLIDAIEIHAVALNNIEMLDLLKDFNKTIFLGVGGTSKEEIDFAINYLKNKDIILMHGFQNYPTKPEYINFNKISKLKKEYNLPVGYADHCSWDFKQNELITLAGFMAGSNIIEKHITLNPGEKRTDYNSSIGINSLKEIKENLELLYKAKGKGGFELTEYEKPYGSIGPMKFTIVAKKDLKKNQIISKDMVTFKRTKQENNILQKEYLNIIGKKLSCDIKKDELISKEKIQK